MTPVIFVTFLISLVVVDYRYSQMRSHNHPEDYPGRLPRWLHRTIYHYRPYQYVRIGKDGKPTKDRVYSGFYHSKQRKLMKMEVEDAFQIRGTVLFILGVLVIVAAWSLWQLMALALRAVGLI